MGDSHLNIAYNLEKFLIPKEQWTDEILDKLPTDDEYEWLREELLSKFSAPIGIAYVPNWGYCVLASGQGPFVVWSGFDIEKYAKEENIPNT